MFNLLTKYLVLYRQVTLPSVGTILLTEQPSRLDVAAKTIQPPTFTTTVGNDDTVPEQQLRFLAAQLQQNNEQVMLWLQQVGRQVNAAMKQDGFTWNGIGVLRPDGGEQVVALPALQPVAAEKVLRSDAEHRVLVGDQHLTSTQIAGRNEAAALTERKRSPLIIAGWIMLVLATLFILFLLYQGKFRVGATGSRQSPTGWLQLPSGVCTPAHIALQPVEPV